MPIFSASTQHTTAHSSQSNRQEKETRAIQTGKKGNKYLFAFGTILYVKSLKDYIHTQTHTQLLEINKFNKVADIKSIHKNQLVFYTLTINKPKRKLRKQFYLQ